MTKTTFEVLAQELAACMNWKTELSAVAMLTHPT